MFLILQYLFVEKFIEPYPAILLPSFSGTSETIVKPVYHTFFISEENDTIIIAPELLFSSTHKDHLPNLLERIFLSEQEGKAHQFAIGKKEFEMKRVKGSQFYKNRKLFMLWILQQASDRINEKSIHLFVIQKNRLITSLKELESRDTIFEKKLVYSFEDFSCYAH